MGRPVEGRDTDTFPPSRPGVLSQVRKRTGRPEESLTPPPPQSCVLSLRTGTARDRDHPSLRYDESPVTHPPVEGSVVPFRWSGGTLFRGVLHPTLHSLCPSSVDYYLIEDTPLETGDSFVSELFPFKSTRREEGGVGEGRIWKRTGRRGTNLFRPTRHNLTPR